MSIDFRLIAPPGKQLPVEEIWSLMHEMYPAETRRLSEREFLISFQEGEFTLDVHDDLENADFSLPLAMVAAPNGLGRPTALALVLAARFGLRCINLQTGRDLLGDVPSRLPPAKTTKKLKR